uniref:Uncharacterized protein n=1 Tax=Anguilla anguilla TaxID=7936 RepID=A0A0E9UPV4_ANGAN
MGKVYKTIIK